MAYQNIPYQNSSAYHSVMSANYQGLQNCKPYYEMAIEFHKREGNTEQVSFFSEGLALIEQRLTKLAPDAAKSAAETE